MKSQESRTLLDSARLRLEDRYVMQASRENRAAFVGSSGTGGGGFKLGIISVALRVWPRIKGWPVVGPAVYGLYRAVRGRARRAK